MRNILIFGGTTEGRELAEFCETHRIPAVICVASSYGRELLQNGSFLTIHEGRLNREEMTKYLLKLEPKLVIDATHPYAALVTENIRAVCESLHQPYIRVKRPELLCDMEAYDGWICHVPDAAAAVELLNQNRETILLTTGSKELAEFMRIEQAASRIYARVLPSSEVLAQCERLGLTGSHILALQGPFSTEMNLATLRMLHVGWLVTKESGQKGGFIQKLQAAQQAGVKVLIIGRPVIEEEGVSVTDIYKRLLSAYDRISEEEALKNRVLEESNPDTRKCLVSLIGIGPGSREQMTVQVVNTICEADAVLGAPRMLEAVKDLTTGKECAPIYLAHDICHFIEAHQALRRIAILFSGDTGFYSGCRALKDQLPDTVCSEILPGISSVSYLCARTGKTWEGLFCSSYHGRDCDVPRLLAEHDCVFLLTGENLPFGKLCQQLMERGYGSVSMTVGERLSYPDETITTGTPETLYQLPVNQLTSVILEKEKHENER